MTTTDDQSAQEIKQHEGLKIVRGACYASLFGVIGFLTPIVVVLAYTVLHWMIAGSKEIDRTADLYSLPGQVVFSTVCMAFVFAGAGWATFAPRGSYRFAWTLLTITAISVPSSFVLSILGMSPPRYCGTEHPPIYPSEVLMFAIPPIASALVLAVMRQKNPAA
jgi:hypothetical protein